MSTHPTELTESLCHQLMGHALDEARQAALEGEVPIGAVVTCCGQIVSRGHNMVRQLRDATAHAEMIALTAAMNSVNTEYLTQCEMFVTVEPCSMCAGAIRWARLSHLVYGAPEPKFGFTQYSPTLLHKRTGVIAGVRAEECKQLMQSFFKRLR